MFSKQKQNNIAVHNFKLPLWVVTVIYSDQLAITDTFLDVHYVILFHVVTGWLKTVRKEEVKYIKRSPTLQSSYHATGYKKIS